MSIPNPPLPDEVAISGPWTANIYSQSSAPPSGPPPLGNAGVSGNNPYITWQDLAVNPNRWFQALDTNNTWQILTATGPTLPTSWTLLLQLSPTQLSLYALQLTGASLPAPPTTPGQQPWFVAAYVGTEANPRFTVDPGGALAWGPGGGSATDVTLSRVATGILQVGGGLRVTGSPAVSTDVATKSYVDTKVAGYLPLTGGTLTGALTLAADPAQPLQAATKQYVDAKWAGIPTGSAGVVGSNPYITWQDLAVTPNRWFQALDTNNTWEILTATGASLPTSWTLLLQLSATQLSLYALQLTGANLPTPPATPGQQPWFVAAYVGTEANPRFTLDPGGAMAWGPGGGSATDVTLSRVSSGLLQVGGNFKATGTLTAVGALSAASASIAGALAAGATTLSGALGFATDNAYDIGTSTGSRPRNLYLAGSATIGGSLSAGSASISGALSAGSGSISGALGVSGLLTASGNITTNSITALQNNVVLQSTGTSGVVIQDTTSTATKIQLLPSYGGNPVIQGLGGSSSSPIAFDIANGDYVNIIRLFIGAMGLTSGTAVRTLRLDGSSVSAAAQTRVLEFICSTGGTSPTTHVWQLIADGPTQQIQLQDYTNSLRVLTIDPVAKTLAVGSSYKGVGFPTYSGTTQSSITVGASPFTYTNNDGTLETVYITGGTVSSINFIRNGVSTQLATTLSGDSVVLLSPGDAVQVTYSSAPTMTKVLV